MDPEPGACPWGAAVLRGGPRPLLSPGQPSPRHRDSGKHICSRPLACPWGPGWLCTGHPILEPMAPALDSRLCGALPGTCPLCSPLGAPTPVPGCLTCVPSARPQPLLLQAAVPSGPTCSSPKDKRRGSLAPPRPVHLPLQAPRASGPSVFAPWGSRPCDENSLLLGLPRGAAGASQSRSSERWPFRWPGLCSLDWTWPQPLPLLPEG